MSGSSHPQPLQSSTLTHLPVPLTLASDFQAPLWEPPLPHPRTSLLRALQPEDPVSTGSAMVLTALAWSRAVTLGPDVQLPCGFHFFALAGPFNALQFGSRHLCTRGEASRIQWPHRQVKHLCGLCRVSHDHLQVGWRGLAHTRRSWAAGLVVRRQEKDLLFHGGEGCRKREGRCGSRGPSDLVIFLSPFFPGG